MHKSIIRKIESFLWYSGLVWLFEKLNPSIGHIIELHRVGEFGAKLQSNKRLSITPEYLEKTILFFKKKKYEFISLDDWVSGKNSKNKFVVFTLDDGYIDNLSNALPIFEKYNVPFTIYICTGFPDNTAILWWYILEDILLNYNSIDFNFRNQSYFFDIKSIKAKENTFKILHTLCIKCNTKDMNELSTVFFDKYSKIHNTILEELALSWEQIKKLSEHPLVTIGSHGINHYPLSTLSLNEIKGEFYESKKQIESQINKNIFHFSYPYGIIPNVEMYNNTIFENCGYKSSVIVRNGNINTKTHPFYLPRISLTNQMSFTKIRLQTSNAMPYIRKFAERYLSRLKQLI